MLTIAPEPLYGGAPDFLPRFDGPAGHGGTRETQPV